LGGYRYIKDIREIGERRKFEDDVRGWRFENRD
jgi:hypothetical protein